MRVGVSRLAKSVCLACSARLVLCFQGVRSPSVRLSCGLGSPPAIPTVQWLHVIARSCFQRVRRFVAGTGLRPSQRVIRSAVIKRTDRLVEPNCRVVEQFQGRTEAWRGMTCWLGVRGDQNGTERNGADSSGEIMPDTCRQTPHSESSPKCPDCFVQVCALTEVIGEGQQQRGRSGPAPCHETLMDDLGTGMT